MEEIIFTVRAEDGGGYSASWDDPRGGGISTQAEDLAELPAMIREAVLCHFDDWEMPGRVRMHFADDPAFVLA